MLDPDPVIEFAGRIPIQHREVDPATAAPLGKRRDLDDQLAAEAVAPRLRFDEQILDVDPGPAFPGRIILKEQGEADRPPVHFRQ